MLQSMVSHGWRRLVQVAMGLGMAALLSACGGGGGSAGDSVFPGGGSGGTGGGTSPTAADLVLTLGGSTLPSDGSGSALVTVYAVDANRNTIANVPVSISVNANALVTTSASKTDTTGVVTGKVQIGSDASLRTITVTAASGSVTKTAQITVVTPSTTGTTTGPTLTLGLSTTQITPKVPATASLQLKSATGTPLSGVVVSLSTTRGNLGVLSVGSVQTDSNGQASVTLSSNSTGLTGADYLVAVASVGSVQVTGQAAFFAQGASPTISVNPQSITLNGATPSTNVAATVLDATGNPVSKTLVTFAAASSTLRITPSSQLTDSNGVATVSVAPIDATTTSSDQLTASATVGSSALQGTVGVSTISSKPGVALTISNSSVTVTQPGTLNARVTDATGAPVPGAVVQFKSQFGLVQFDASTATTASATNSSTGAVLGQATVHVSPVTAASNGGDLITAQVTVNGVQVTTQQAVQVVSAAAPGNPSLALALSSTSVSSGSPATVTATLTDSLNRPVPGQVVTFTVVRKLGVTNVGTALTNASGQAVVLLSPASTTSAGADEVTASVSYAGINLSATQGFQVQATNASIVSFTGPASLSAYGQDTLTLTLSGASVNSPVKVSISSSCAAAGKATVSPSSISATTNTVTLQYRDNGCGAIQPSDLLQAVIDGTSAAQQLTLPIAAPAASSLAFISASPEQIFLKGSGFTETSVVTFEVRDAAGNTLPNKSVDMTLLTGAGGVTMQGGLGVGSTYTSQSNSLGRVSVQVNSGTQPTPVRIQATLSGTSISTVSSNLSISIGLPSQLNFSFSQKTKNIEGFNIDGIPNSYTIIAADRSGNPVPVGTSINFVTEGGQIESTKQIQQVNGISRASANFVSAEPRPADGRVTVVAYALGEESFIDKYATNVYQSGDEFQDLGNIFISRDFSGIYKSNVDQVISLNINNSSACHTPADPASLALLGLNTSIPSVPNTCDGIWSGAGQVYVRRATETVLSTSAARPLWPYGTSSSRVTFANSPIVLQVSSSSSDTLSFYPAGGDSICTTSKSGSFNLIVADANNARLNPMAAGTTVTATTPTSGFGTTVNGGSPVPSTTDAPPVSIGYSFDPTASAPASGALFVTFTSPSSTATTVGFTVNLKVSCP